ncbi:hypothetical protein T265_00992 [Opisthorchis viverrini]|uniref:Uncharacterized protein n=1 Tax=Opisthorchis viverrini TaxID=6198 RepID=A0A075AJB5_OPIVI|nr:hypothetical protein T265_00992 [Opisthorchis viverrini]KER33094.1 hypothetical protein T265_00992 [Opisthorchis viverrini]
MQCNRIFIRCFEGAEEYDNSQIPMKQLEDFVIDPVTGTGFLQASGIQIERRQYIKHCSRDSIRVRHFSFGQPEKKFRLLNQSVNVARIATALRTVALDA